MFVDDAYFSSWEGLVFQNFTTDGANATFCGGVYAAAGATWVSLYLYDENYVDVVDVYWYDY